MFLRSKAFYQLGYLLAGLINVVGILIVSSGFSSEAFHTALPSVFGEFGALMIMVWGLAYWSVIPQAEQAVWPPFVFAIEKLVYVGVWLFMVLPSFDTIGPIVELDPTVALFYRTFGLIDLAFAVFFGFACIQVRKARLA